MAKANVNKMNSWDTPENTLEILSFIESRPEAERIALYKVMGMTWNYVVEAHDAIKKFGGDSSEHL